MASAGSSQGQGPLPSARQAQQKAGNKLMRAGQEAKLRQATRQYEAYFLSTLWKEMRKGGQRNPLVNGGYGEEVFTGLLDQARSDVMAARGGLGVAELLEKQLARQDLGKSPRAAASALKPAARPASPATAPAAEEPLAAEPESLGGSGEPVQPLLDLPPAGETARGANAVTLPMPRDEDGEESATTAWPPAPAVQAPLSRKPAQTQEMDPPLQGAVTSTFGLRLHPISGEIRPHQGLDLAAPEGTPIGAARAGVVRFAGVAGDYGRLVVVEHDDGASTFYGHCKTLSVTPGQRVAQGQMVGRVGMTGLATGPHLHFEVRDASGRAVDPLPMLAGRLNTSS